eukprot:TRINITY_DN11581_c0_g1_i12.p1 TRINITY_DN11581_c0_g1~~TRINITY_DN11581_c0_g1_i12.p1  ORF type:complete len:593 (+),score=38.35 TRINITY_DN11581_c0_g1_i12:152-1780(+)
MTCYMEVNEAGIRRFWEIRREETKVIIHHGRVGCNGVTLHKNFENTQDANNYLQRSLQTKKQKGYKLKKNLVKKRAQNIGKRTRRSSPRQHKRINGKICKQTTKERQSTQRLVHKKEYSLNDRLASQKREMRMKTQRKDTNSQHSGPGQVDTRINMYFRYKILEQDGFKYDVQTNSNSAYYLLQILADQKTNSENVKLYSCWGQHGSVGRFQLTACRDVEHALRLFAAKFGDKTGRDWHTRHCYRPKRGKYVWTNQLQNQIYAFSQYSSKQFHQSNAKNVANVVDMDIIQNSSQQLDQSNALNVTNVAAMDIVQNSCQLLDQSNAGNVTNEAAIVNIEISSFSQHSNQLVDQPNAQNVINVAAMDNIQSSGQQLDQSNTQDVTNVAVNYNIQNYGQQLDQSIAQNVTNIAANDNIQSSSFSQHSNQQLNQSNAQNMTNIAENDNIQNSSFSQHSSQQLDQSNAQNVTNVATTNYLQQCYENVENALNVHDECIGLQSIPNTCIMDENLQNGETLISNLVTKILSPTLSDFENEEVFVPESSL